MRSLAVLLLMFAFSCATVVKCEDVTTVSGLKTYCTGKVAGDGQEGIFRDVHSAKGLEAAQLHGGSSLWGQALVGAVAAGELAGGAIGAAALIRPPTSNNVTTSRSDQSQLQGQQQQQDQTSVNVNSNTNSNHNSNVNKNKNYNKLTNHNTDVIKINDGPGHGSPPGDGGHGGPCGGNCGNGNGNGGGNGTGNEGHGNH